MLVVNPVTLLPPGGQPNQGYVRMNDVNEAWPGANQNQPNQVYASPIAK